MITTAAAGNWSAPSTWTGAVVPGLADVVQINHQVTLDVNVSIAGVDPAGTGSLIARTTQFRVLVGLAGRPSYVMKPLVL